VDYWSDLADLERIDWDILQRRDFKKRDINDPTKCERYQAEALIHHHVPVAALSGIACYGSAQQARIQTEADRLGLQTKIVARSDWYF
jgi:hypothetical protein